MTLPEHEFFRVDAVDARVVAFDWTFERERYAEITAHWERVLEDKPETFDGRLFLTCGWSIEDEAGKSILRSQHFETGYSAFLAWNDFGRPGGNISNSFAAAAVRGADGGFLVGEMGSQTTHAGK